MSILAQCDNLVSWATDHGIHLTSYCHVLECGQVCKNEPRDVMHPYSLFTSMSIRSGQRRIDFLHRRFANELQSPGDTGDSHIG